MVVAIIAAKRMMAMISVAMADSRTKPATAKLLTNQRMSVAVETTAMANEMVSEIARTVTPRRKATTVKVATTAATATTTTSLKTLAMKSLHARTRAARTLQMPMRTRTLSALLVATAVVVKIFLSHRNLQQRRTLKKW